MHVELYGTTSEKDFIARTFQSLNQLESNFDRLLKSVSSALKNVKLNLSINQKKTLKLILLNDGSNLFNADALKSVNLKTGSLVTKALSSLMNKEIIRKNGKYVIQDTVFKKWLQKTLLL